MSVVEKPYRALCQNARGRSLWPGSSREALLKRGLCRGLMRGTRRATGWPGRCMVADGRAEGADWEDPEGHGRDWSAAQAGRTETSLFGMPSTLPSWAATRIPPSHPAGCCPITPFAGEPRAGLTGLPRPQGRQVQEGSLELQPISALSISHCLVLVFVCVCI